ncbi:DNA cytosine methyltransferase [Agrobacterium rubi]|uniref:DNA (cytosine-5-)-methyltransferase n=1 Tax=Agrobacterium rubi TaxID=28099 RepID=A0AAE7RC72_9HYPH|nr:DNA cytosine methyltransferase [Agrobacterium rubi]NTE86102.1 DNA methyltransferase [Agrobacterium rubi]NTF02033.1 DNA methyltransferase [Agrobacterium rubi]NTF36277.1 DNA methyltransferase [Agrobacterium rubi]QTG01354.1 DNA methyltransferase [Agrobacterium rubi]
MRAIDVYSGVGGWSLGLKMAGIEVVDSYEWHAPANETNFRNNGHHANLVDVRTLELQHLPQDIDIVVGSPPCTQFSLSNRGGSGDFEDGLKDIAKFLEIVEYLKPKYWAMENVPRVIKILKSELSTGGLLERYKNLGCDIEYVDMSEFGLPQRRRRCIVGNINFELLRSYRAQLRPILLGDIVSSLRNPPFIDPIYGITVNEVHDHGKEDVLNAEEVRLNKAAKTLHPVYNTMPFPDPLDKTVRTITATCTRVSRESVVIQDPATYRLRRLTLRERATAQGFPISFQFYGSSFGQKLQMIGNAVPPLFSFFVGQALQNVQPENLLSAKQAIARFNAPNTLPPETPNERSGSKYPAKRRFRMSIPSLHLKSGVRFDLTNQFDGDLVQWEVSFTFGTSKEFRKFPLENLDNLRLKQYIDKKTRVMVDAILSKSMAQLESFNAENVQRVWCHRGPSETHPFRVVDLLDETAIAISSLLTNTSFNGEMAMSYIHEIAVKISQASDLSFAKLFRNSSLITTGLLVSHAANSRILNDQRLVKSVRAVPT